MQKSISEIEKRLKYGGGPSSGKSKLSDSDLDLELRRLRKEFDEYRILTSREIKDIYQILPQKANIADLQELEVGFNDTLFDLNKRMSTFALKEDVSKRFNLTGRRIREIVEMVSKNVGQDDDGMLTKKNLG